MSGKGENHGNNHYCQCCAWYQRQQTYSLWVTFSSSSRVISQPLCIVLVHSPHSWVLPTALAHQITSQLFMCVLSLPCWSSHMSVCFVVASKTRSISFCLLAEVQTHWHDNIPKGMTPSTAVICCCSRVRGAGVLRLNGSSVTSTGIRGMWFDGFCDDGSWATIMQSLSVSQISVSALDAERFLRYSNLKALTNPLKFRSLNQLIHAWGRDRMSSEERQTYSLMAYGMLAGCLQEDFKKQPYQFRRTLVTHMRVNIQHSVMAKKETVDRYYDDAHEKFGRLLSEQGYDSEAEKFRIQVLNERSRTCGEEHLDTISAMGDLARELSLMPHWFLQDSGHSCRIQWNPEESNLADTPAKMTFQGTNIPAEWCHFGSVAGMVPGMDKKECNQNAMTGIDITNQ